MRGKRILTLGLAAVLGLTATGCGGWTDVNETTAKQTEVETTAAPTATPTVAPTPTPMPDYHDSLVVNQDGVEAFRIAYIWEEESFRVIPYGNQYFLICDSQYEEAETEDADAGETAEARTGTYFRLMDRTSGDIVDQVNFPDCYLNLDSLQVNADGTFSADSMDDLYRYTWNRSLQMVWSFDFNQWNQERQTADAEAADHTAYDLTPAADGLGGYYIESNALMYVNYADHQVTRLADLPQSSSLKIDGLYFDGSLLCVGDHVDSSADYSYYDVSNLADGVEMVYETCIGMQQLLTTEDSYVAYYEDLTYGEYRLLFGNRQEADSLNDYAPADKLNFYKAILTADGNDLIASEDYTVLVDYDLDENQIRHLDLKNYYDGSLADDYLAVYTLPLDEDRVLVQMNGRTGSEEVGNGLIYMIDFEANAESTAEEAATMAITTSTWTDRTDAVLAELLGIADAYQYSVGFLKSTYADTDAYADAIENKYQVQVFTGAECASLDAPDYNVELVTDEAVTWTSLAHLDKALSIYPEDFFAQCKQGFYTDGISFYLVNNLIGLEGTNNIGTAVGLTFTDVHSHKVALSCNNSSGFEDTVYHEISHVIDAEIEFRNYQNTDSFFTEDQWNALNPEGFAYANDYTVYHTDFAGTALGWTFSSYDGSGDSLQNIYFVDDYALLYAKEDRARLMEYAVAYPTRPELTSPNMQSKLQYMCDYIRHYFDDSNWPEVLPWEKALNTAVEAKG